MNSEIIMQINERSIILRHDEWLSLLHYGRYEKINLLSQHQLLDEEELFQKKIKIKSMDLQILKLDELEI